MKIPSNTERSFLKKLAGSKFLVVSLLIHLTFIALVGGVVLFRAADQYKVFEVSSFGGFIEEAPAVDAEPEEETPVEFEDAPAAQPMNSSPVSMVQTLNSSVPMTTSAIADVQYHGASLAPAREMALSSELNGIGRIRQSGGKTGGLFGDKTILNGLTGSFYDLKQTSKGDPSEIADSTSYLNFCAKFAEEWNPSLLRPFFKAKDSLGTYQIFMPVMSASAAPEAFGVGDSVKPIRWLVHYQGTLTAPVSGKFRFAGQGDNILVVRFNRKVVLDAGLEPLLKDVQREPIGATPDPAGRPMVAGEWFTLSAGSSYPVEIILGEYGGLYAAYLLIQEQGKTYPLRKDQKSPILPVVQVAPTQMPEFEPDKNAPEVARKPFVFSVK